MPANAGRLSSFPVGADQAFVGPIHPWVPPAGGSFGPAAADHFQKLMNPVMMIALVKSMKNAPTSGATRKARGAAP